MVSVRNAEELVTWVVDQSERTSGRDLLDHLAPKLRRLGIIWELASEYALLRGAEGVTVPDEFGATLCFASNSPSLSAVLEELAHIAQWRGPAPDEDLRIVRDRREVEAKKCLVDHAETLRIPDPETVQTRRQLEDCRRSLARYEEMLQ